MEGIIPQHGGISHNTDITDATLSHAKSDSVPRLSLEPSRICLRALRQPSLGGEIDGPTTASGFEHPRLKCGGQVARQKWKSFRIDDFFIRRNTRLAAAAGWSAGIIAQGVDFIKLSSLSLPYITEISGDTAGSRR